MKLKETEGLVHDEDSHYWYPISSMSNDVEEPSVPNFAWDKGKTIEIEEIEAAAEDDKDSLYQYPTSSITDYVKEPYVLNYAWDKGKTKESKRNVESGKREQPTPFGPEL